MSRGLRLLIGTILVGLVALLSVVPAESQAHLRSIFAGIISKSGLGTTSTDGLTLDNVTDATAGTTVQISPRVRWRGRAWDTAASQTVDFFAEHLPISAGTPTATWRLGYSLNGAAASYPLTVASTGALTAAGATADIFSGRDVRVAAAGVFYWNGRGQLLSQADGLVAVENTANTFGVQINTGTAAPTSGTGFGASPFIVTGARNSAGGVNVGTGAAATTGIVAFGAPAWTNAPFCTAGVETGTASETRAMGVKATTTQMTFAAASAWVASTTVVWNCLGRI